MASAVVAKACPKPMKATSDGVWAGHSPVEYALPLLTIQLLLIVLFSRAFEVILKPLRQPRVIAEVLGGVVLGASALGHIPGFSTTIFPKASLPVLTTVANIGLLFFLFMVGLELDTRALLRTGRSAMIIAMAGMVLPFTVGIATSFAAREILGLHSTRFGPFLVFMGVAMSITAFPVLARILAERRLLTTDVGQMAMSAAAVDDVVAWTLLALAVALSSADASASVVAWIILCAITYVIVMFVIVRPFMAWLTKGVVDDEPIPEWIVAITLIGVILAGFITDTIGIHGIFGAFIFGLSIPKDGPFCKLILEKIEDLTRIVLLPLYFASSGLNVKIDTISSAASVGLLFLVIFTACFGKVVGITLASLAHGIPFRKSLVMGVLMNTKGLVELIVLNIGLEKKVINQELYTIMVIMALVTTFMTTPLVIALYKPARDPIPHKKTSLEAAIMSGSSSNDDDEVRMVVCVQGMRNLIPILNFMEISRGSLKKRPLRTYLLHLQELSERSSSMMLVSSARKNGKPFWSSSKATETENDKVVVAFQAFGNLCRVQVQTSTVLGSYAGMHEDICETASERRANIIILPYYKTLGPHGQLELASPGMEQVSSKILRSAPCSVGIFVDRGFGGVVQDNPNTISKKVAVLFFGGPDDREALILAKRMSQHPGVSVRVLRLRPRVEGDDVAVEILAEDLSMEGSLPGRKVSPLLSILPEKDPEEDRKDNEAIAALVGVTRKATAADGKESSDASREGWGLVIEEKEVSDLEVGLSDLGKEDLDLIIVGREQLASPLVTGLKSQLSPARHNIFGDASLGFVGEALANMELNTSILVVKQHKGLAVVVK